jgi:hypothetical protein
MSVQPNELLDQIQLILNNINLVSAEQVKLIDEIMEQYVPNTSNETYFDTQAEALFYAIHNARKRGYDLKDKDYTRQMSGIVTGGTNRYVFDLTRRGKESKKGLIVLVYQMESGKVELTHYIN